MSMAMLSDFSGFYWVYVIFWMLLSFIIYYISIYIAFNKYILKKIKPYFDTIDILQIPDSKHYDYIDDGELLKDIDKRFMQWAKIKLKEIATLRANEKYRKEFLGNVSHELKTPLFNMQGYISTLIDGGIDDKKINVKYLQRTEKNINRLISVVKDLESISALESGFKKLNLTNFDIIQLINELVEMQEIRANKKGINLVLNVNKNKSVYVKADKDGVADILSNLLINSIIYGKENGTTTINIEQKNKKVFISIIDNGIGIKQKDINRIFERFYRVDKSRSKLQGGTGLGLSIVKHIIEAHKQKIKVVSKLNEGCNFTFSLEAKK